MIKNDSTYPNTSVCLFAALYFNVKVIKRLCYTVITTFDCLLRFFNLTNVPKMNRHKIQPCVFTSDTLTLSKLLPGHEALVEVIGNSCLYLHIKYRK